LLSILNEKGRFGGIEDCENYEGYEDYEGCEDCENYEGYEKYEDYVGCEGVLYWELHSVRCCAF
jgi:hypothetical protein